MNDLADVSMHPSQLSFCNLRDLHVHECAELTCLFTFSVASGLKKLERLKISQCPKLVSLCDTTSVNVIELPQLVVLILDGLPNFTSIYADYDNASVMQSFLSKERLLKRNRGKGELFLHQKSQLVPHLRVYLLWYRMTLRLLLLNSIAKLILLQEMKFFNTWPYLWPSWHYLLKLQNKYQGFAGLVAGACSMAQMKRDNRIPGTIDDGEKEVLPNPIQLALASAVAFMNRVQAIICFWV